MRNLFVLALFTLLSACYLHDYPLTFDSAESGTYKMFADIGQGTAWAIDEHHLVTAGHMCETMDANSVLISSNGRRFRAKSITWEKDGAYQDLCILETQSSLSSPLTLSDRMPYIGERVAFVGYPLGELSKSSGIYLGDTDGPTNDYDDYTFTAPCDHGASGSAVYIDRGVWGVLVRLRLDEDNNVALDGTHGCVAIPLARIEKILQDNDVQYDQSPEEIPAPTIFND